VRDFLVDTEIDMTEIEQETKDTEFKEYKRGDKQDDKVTI
jgi:hypothetical protein